MRQVTVRVVDRVLLGAGEGAKRTQVIARNLHADFLSRLDDRGLSAPTIEAIHPKHHRLKNNSNDQAA